MLSECMALSADNLHVRLNNTEINSRFMSRECPVLLHSIKNIGNPSCEIPILCFSVNGKDATEKKF